MDKTDPPQRFTDTYLLYLLAQASSKASAEFHNSLSKNSISVSTWRILATLYPDAPATVGELAQICMIKQPTMTRQLDRLVSDGLIARHEGQDRRRVVIKLTPAGKKIAHRLTETAKAHEAKLLNGLDPDDVARMIETLQKLAQ